MSGTIKCFHFQPLPAKKKSKKKGRNHDLGQPGAVSGPKQAKPIFREKSDSVTYGPPTLCSISKKPNEPIPRKVGY